jgi:hypothetical protein
MKAANTVQQKRLTALETILKHNAEKEAAEMKHLMGLHCCAQEGYVFAPDIHATDSCSGCTYNDNLQPHHCCELCARHPPCTDWEFTSENTCILKHFLGVAGENEWDGQVFVPYHSSTKYHPQVSAMAGTVTEEVCPGSLQTLSPLPETQRPTPPPTPFILAPT